MNSDDYNSGGAYKAMLKLFRDAKMEEKKITKCLRCNNTRKILVWSDTSETKKIKTSCPMCDPQRPPQELRDLGII